MAKSQMTGMRAVYLVCAEMTKHGLVAYPTSRNAMGADILIATNDCRKSYAVQVKANAANASFWLTGEKSKKMKSPTFFYVFVNMWENKKNGETIEYYVVPSSIVSKNVEVSKRPNSTWHSFERQTAAPYKNKWDVFK